MILEHQMDSTQSFTLITSIPLTNMQVIEKAN